MLIKVNVDLCLGFISCPLNVLRKDRYNKKLKKYYVVYEENDTELSEDEERHERKDAEAPCFPLVRPPILVQLLFGQHSLSPQVDPGDVAWGSPSWDPILRMMGILTRSPKLFK